MLFTIVVIYYHCLLYLLLTSEANLGQILHKLKVLSVFWINPHFCNKFMSKYQHSFEGLACNFERSGFVPLGLAPTLLIKCKHEAAANWSRGPLCRGAGHTIRPHDLFYCLRQRNSQDSPFLGGARLSALPTVLKNYLSQTLNMENH